MPEQRPYGSWPTPITSELVVSAAVRLGEIAVSGGRVWWSEQRPEEGGRTQIVRTRPDGGTEDVLDAGGNARTAVHEYGGGAWWVHGDRLWYANWADQRLYRWTAGEGSRPITPAPDRPRGTRWADGSVHPDGDRIAIVREVHNPGEGATGVGNEIVVLPAEGGEPTVVAADADFVASPRWSPDGTRLCWLSWNHPDMPWDATLLRVRGPDDVETVVAGGSGESVFQPQWAPDGSLWFAADRTGWWNLYRWHPDRPGEAAEPQVLMEADIGRPHWVFAQSAYAFLDDGRAVFAYTSQGRDRLALLHPDGVWTDLATQATTVDALRAEGSAVVLVASSPTEEPSVVRLRIGTHAIEAQEPLRPPRELGVDPGWFSVPEHVSFPSNGGRTAYAWVYPPTSPAFEGPPDERPPLLVFIHGGPTGMAQATLRMGVQYWTSRGFAVADVNYGGSAGYGRAYREQLKGGWGVVDVDDCVAAARWLAEQGRVDGARLCIRGGSAGGFTTLAALAFCDAFAAGASQFGVADLEVLAQETHKFESRYLDGLVGPYPQQRDRYIERSPIHHVDSFNAPLAVFQGLEDEVVPPAQSQMIVDALRAKQVPVAYVTFAGEQHGFRQAGNIRRALDGELSFYAQVLGFDLSPHEGIDPIEVEGLPRA